MSRGSAPKAKRQTAAEARAEAQARAASGKVARDAAIAERFDDGVPGAGILRATKLTTAVWAVVTVIVAVVDTRGLRIALALFDSALFVVGCVIFVLALYEGAQRSREADLTMVGWWFLSGSAPTFVRTTLLGAVAVQTVVALATAAIRIETTLAFGILVPTLALAFCGLWGARYGLFPPRKFAQEQVAIPRRRGAAPSGTKAGGAKGSGTRSNATDAGAADPGTTDSTSSTSSTPAEPAKPAGRRSGDPRPDEGPAR